MKGDKYTKILDKNQVCAIFHLRDIRKNVLPNFMKFCMGMQKGTDMAAGSQQKHLFLSFPANPWILRLRKS